MLLYTTASWLLEPQREVGYKGAFPDLPRVDNLGSLCRGGGIFWLALGEGIDGVHYFKPRHNLACSRGNTHVRERKKGHYIAGGGRALSASTASGHGLACGRERRRKCEAAGGG